MFYPSIFDIRTANVTTTGGKLSRWHAGMHHFVAYCELRNINGSSSFD